LKNCGDGFPITSASTPAAYWERIGQGKEENRREKGGIKVHVIEEGFTMAGNSDRL